MKLKFLLKIFPVSREIDDSGSFGHEPKRFKGDASAVQEDSTPDSKVETKQETKSLSKNELNAKRRVDFKLKKEILKEQKSKDERTIFVGNVALTVTKKVGQLFQLSMYCPQCRNIFVTSQIRPLCLGSIPGIMHQYKCYVIENIAFDGHF